MVYNYKQCWFNLYLKQSAVFLLFLLFSTVSMAATFTVSNTNDSGAGSLRQAILDANAAGGTVMHTIEFSIPGGSSISLTSAATATSALLVNANVTILGPSGGVTLTRTSGTVRVLEINTGKVVVIRNLTLRNGAPVAGQTGGGIFNAGNLSLYNCTIQNNTVTGSGGHGGGIRNNDNATLNLYNCVVKSNSCSGEGGGIQNRAGASMTINNSVIELNTASGSGGGIAHMVGATPTTNKIVGSFIRNNTSGNHGGGINNGSALAIYNSQINNNSCTQRGGGIGNEGNTTVNLVVRNSTINNNTANSNGGGVHFFGNGTFNFANVTISTNTTNVGGGGGLGTSASGVLNNCTIALNRTLSTGGEGGGIRVFGGTTELNYCVIAGNTSAATSNNARQADLNGNRFSTYGRNIIGNAGAPPFGSWNTGSVTTGNNTTTIPVADILNTSLADNGGGVPTHALVANSVAINPTLASGFTSNYDQRGYARTGTPDAGAFEFGGIAPSISTIAATDIRTKSVQFNANLSTAGLSVKLSFEYGLTTDYGMETAPLTTSGGGTTSIVQNTSNLTAGTVYNYRAKLVFGVNDELTLYGSNLTFTTPAASADPVITMADADLLLYTSSSSSIQLDNGLTIADSDNATLKGVTVQVTENSRPDEDTFTFSPVAGITSNFNPSATGGALLTFSGDASVQDYEALLQSLRYENSKGQNATYAARRILVKVDDGLNFASDSRRIILSFSENSPLLNDIELTNLSYAEASGAKAVSATIVLTDPNSTQMTSGSVQIVSNYKAEEDLLSFTGQAGITGTWDSATGKLTLAGTASLADYQAVFRSVQYTNSSLNPNTDVRTVTFKTNDGVYESNPASRNITVVAVNNAPVLANIEATGITHEEGAVAENISSAITVSDVDNTTLSSATVQITANYKNGQDVLSFINQNGITSVWNAATGTLTLSGTASLANYETALRSVKYYQAQNYAFSGSVRTVSITVKDGSLNSVSATRNITPTQKPVVNFNYAEALQKSLYFYEAQRSGALPSVRGKNPGENRVEWRGNSLMNDGADVGKDLTGGWYDAGDTYKCNSSMAYASSFLAWSGIEYNNVFEETNQKPYLLDNLKFINDYFIKCFVNDQPGTYEYYTQVTSGTFAHNQWAAPEVLEKIFTATGANPSYKIDVTCKGSDVAGHTAASLASSSIVFRNAGGADNIAYADLLLDKARKMFDFGDTYRGVDGHRNAAGVVSKTQNYFYRSDNYWDEMMWAAIWLHKAEQAASTAGYTDSYLNKANEYYSLTPNPDGAYAHFAELFFSNVAPAAFTLMAKETTGTTQATYKRRVERWLDWWTIGYTDKVRYTPGGLATKTSASANAYAPLRYSTNQAFVAGIYSDWMTSGVGVDGATAPLANPAITTSIDRKAIYDKFAQTQVKYALGDNPYKRSYLVGFGPNPWNAPHHRAAYGPWAGFEHFIAGKPQYNVTTPKHVLYGALLGGPGKTDGNFNPLDEFDLSVNNITNSVTNEVALDFNAGLPGAFARLYIKNPGTGSVLADFPANETREDEFFVEASVNAVSSSSIDIKAQVNNRSAWPARSSDKLSTKYFFTLEPTIDVSSLSVTQGPVTPNTNTEGAVISPIQNFSGDIYYVTIDFAGKDIFPGGLIQSTNDPGNVYWMREANFTITGPEGWNNNNDWSYNGIAPLSTGSPEKTKQMPVYENGVLIFGTEPTDDVPPTLVSASISSNNQFSNLAKTGDEITLTFKSSETISTPTVTVAGNPVILTKVGNNYTATYTITGSESEGPIAFVISGYSDLYGNPGANVIATTDSTSVTFDRTAPSAPGSLAGVGTNTTATLNWAANTEADIAKYKVYGNTTGSTTVLATVDAPSTTYSQSGLTNGTTYSYRVTAIDKVGNESVLSEEVNVVPVSVPTGIILTETALYENKPAGALAGTLSSTSEDPLGVYTYQLVEGDGSTDNALFSISGNEIRTASTFNFEEKAQFSVRVRTTNQYNNSLEKELVIQISDVNEQPTLADIANQVFCSSTATQLVALSGITSGPESGQNLTVSVSSSDGSLFESLQGSPVSASGTATVQFSTKAVASGTATLSVTVTDNGGTANGGINSITKTFQIQLKASPDVTITSNKGTELSKNEAAQLRATGGGTYQWVDAPGILTPQDKDKINVRPTETTTYKVLVTNAEGCTTEKSITIVVTQKENSASGANILTPNGDGVNDRLVVKGLDLYPNNELKVFDKAGRLLYSQRNYTDQWDGRVNGVVLNEDTYYYIVDLGPGKTPMRGFVTIVRD